MPISIRETMAGRAEHPSLPAWVRVGCLAWFRAGADGHAPMYAGELARTLNLSRSQVSQALTQARDRGWIDPCSTSRCIVLPGMGAGRCEERHR